MLNRLPPAFQHTQFRKYWVGILFAWAGNQMLIWTLYWHIRELTSLPIALGVVGVIRLVPTLVFSLLSGMVADKVDRRKILYISQSTLIAVAITLSVISFRGEMKLGYIYALFALHTLAFTFDTPSRQSLIPALVPLRDLPNALSLQMIAFQIGALSGPVLSGVIMEYFGMHVPYLLAAIGFGVMLTMLLVMDQPEQELAPIRINANKNPIKEGIKFTFRHPLIFPSMLLDFLVTLFTRADTLMPIFAKDILHVGQTQYGWLSAAQAMGAILAGLVLSSREKVNKQGALLLTVVSTVGIGTIVFGLSRNYYLSILALMLVGASDAVSTIIRNAIRQLQTPDRLRGRMVSVNQLFFSGGPHLGELRSGGIAQLIGVPLSVALGGVACLAAVGTVAVKAVRLRRFNGDEPMIPVRVD